MRAAAIIAFLAGLLLAVRVMFFGVQRRVGEEGFAHRRWPLAMAAFLVAAGASLYALVDDGTVTGRAAALVLLWGAASAWVAWWIVQRSAAMPSTDPEDDPRYRFQGHVARITAPIGKGNHAAGRVEFEFDGRRHDLRAVWAVEGELGPAAGSAGSEVVIERVEDDVAYVEPWAAVEQRL